MLAEAPGAIAALRCCAARPSGVIPCRGMTLMSFPIAVAVMVTKIALIGLRAYRELSLCWHWAADQYSADRQR